MTTDPRLHRVITAQPYPLVFLTISGAHLYGFPSPDSDFDLRGAHVLPLEKVIGLDVRDETVEDSRIIERLACQAEAKTEVESATSGDRQRGSLRPDVIGYGRRLELDIVTHDVRKFFGLLLKKNGYVLEQLYSPLVVHTTPEHAELKEICRARISNTSPNPRPGQGGEGVITKHHSHHYFGFAETQWKLFDKERPRRVKPVLYVYRVLLTGIHLMRTGEVEANLVTLNEEFRLPYIADLVARKLAGAEKARLEGADIAFHEAEYQRLRGELQAAHDASQLPESPSDGARKTLNDLLLRVRLASHSAP